MFRPDPADAMISKAVFLMVVVASICLLCSCGIETNRDRAVIAQENTVLRRLLVSLELFREKNGTLPATLEMLRQSDPKIRDIIASAYTYSPTGTVVAYGSTWLITATNVSAGGEVTVGRLPLEVARKARLKR